MTPLEHTFRLPIGDWSGDGHSHCEYYTIESNKPLKEVRELYWLATERLGVALDERHKKEFETPCGDYERSTFDIDWLEKAGLTLADIGLKESDLEDEDTIQANEELFVHMFIAFVMKHCEGVELRHVEADDMFPFYGYDDKQRHIGFFGYGLYSD